MLISPHPELGAATHGLIGLPRGCFQIFLPEIEKKYGLGLGLGFGKKKKALRVEKGELFSLLMSIIQPERV